MIIHGVGERYEQRRLGRRRQLRHGQRAGATDHQIRPIVGVGHICDKVADLGVNAGSLIALAGRLVLVSTGLVAHLGTRLGG